MVITYIKNEIVDDIVMPCKRKGDGNQIFHINSVNRKYKDKIILRFIKENFKTAAPINSDASILKYASQQVGIDGLFLEFGVCTGKTTNFIAALNPFKVIHGFDSFEGLPEDWYRDTSEKVKKALKKKVLLLLLILINCRVFYVTLSYIKGCFMKFCRYLKNIIKINL